MRALLVSPVLLAAALRPSTQFYASLPRRVAFDASLPHRSDAALPHPWPLGAVAGGWAQAEWFHKHIFSRRRRDAVDFAYGQLGVHRLCSNEEVSLA